MKKPTQKDMKEFLELAPLAKRYEELKKQFKEFMEEENESTFKNGEYNLTLTTKTRKAFDQTTFKNEHSKLYEEYKREQEYKTVNVTKG